jgi:spermidine synthase
MTNLIKSLYESAFGKLLAEKYSHGARIRIIKKGPYKELIYNSTVFSRIVEGRLLTGSYWDYFLPLPSLFKSPKILVIGLGGGTIPYQIESVYKSASIDVIEIDEAIASMYRIFIGRELKSRIIIGDGIEYMESHSNEYDLIILDAYIDDNMPDGFFSGKMVTAAYNALREKGLLAINYTLTALGIANSKRLSEFLSKNFRVYSLGMPAISGNRVVICSKGIEIGALEKIGPIPNLKEDHSYIEKAYLNVKEEDKEVI